MDGKLHHPLQQERQSAGRTQSAALVRNPAWSGLRPGLPRSERLEEERKTQILQQAGIDPADISDVVALCLGGEPAAMYRLDLESGKTLLLKMVAGNRQKSVLRAEAIASWLAGQGLDVPAPLEDFPRQTVDGNLAILLPFVKGTRLKPAISDMCFLGKAVGAFHKTLSRHPDQPAWRSSTESRLTELEAIRVRLASKKRVRAQYVDSLADLASDPALDFRFDHLPARPLHGDLNPGNILKVKGNVVLLDFEDVFHSMLPVAFDLAVVLERLILANVANDDTAVDLGRAFMGEYQRSGGNFDDLAMLGEEGWTAILRSLALRSLCILALGEQGGVAVETEEWQKFFWLEQLAKEKGHLLARMTRETEIP